MIIGLICIVIGLVIGFYIPFSVPSIYSLYFSVAILAALDSVFGAIKAMLEDKFESAIFVTGFIGNSVIAGVLTYVGDKIGIPLYYAAIFTFGSRLFLNFAIIRRLIIEKIKLRKPN